MVRWIASLVGLLILVGLMAIGWGLEWLPTEPSAPLVVIFTPVD
jgi:hypothetical protein